jgi:serine/threonine protein kinase
LEKLHEYEIIHRDLKPKNIMINYATDDIFLIDFGLSSKYINQNQHHIPFKSTG